MKTPRASDPQPIQTEWPRQQPDAVPQNDEVPAWESLGDDLWLPHRIRGSWRGGVLG
jgi:hypothetical protein